MADNTEVQKPFCVVVFEGGDVAAVPVSWVTNGYCPWPSKPVPKNLVKLLKTPGSIPSKDWPNYEVEVKKSYGSAIVFKLVDNLCD